jgi:hypothetical protein
MNEPAPPPDPTDEKEKLVAYLDGELSEIEAEEIHARLGRDPQLRLEADALTQTWELLNYLPRPQAPQDFTAKTVQRLETAGYVLRQRGERWRRLALLGWVGVIFLAALLSFLLVFYWPFRESHAAATPTVPAPSATGPEEFPDPHLGAAPGRLPQERQWDKALLWLRLEIARLERELAGRLSKGEAMLLREKRQAGGLEYLDALLELAKTHQVPLRGPITPGAGPIPRPRPSATGNRSSAPVPP